MLSSALISVSPRLRVEGPFFVVRESTDLDKFNFNAETRRRGDKRREKHSTRNRIESEGGVPSQTQ